MNQKPKRTQRDYSLAFKLSVVEEVEKGFLSYQQAQEKYGIQGRSTVLVWLRKHGQQNWSTESLAMKESQETPAQEIRRLKKALEREKLKTRFLNDVIDTLDQDHGTGLRKKYLDNTLEDTKPKE